MNSGNQRAADAALIAALLAVDPAGLGGIWLRVRSREIQSDFERLLRPLPHPAQRISPNTDDITLYGGADLAASLAAGRLVTASGLLERHPCLWLSQAQDAPLALSARLSAALDGGETACLILCDESSEPDERAHDGLCDRVAFFFHDDGLSSRALAGAQINLEAVATARRKLAAIRIDEAAIARVATLCAAFGMASARIPSFVLRAARAHSALHGRHEMDMLDLETAERLVLAHRVPADMMSEDDQPEVDKSEAEPDTEDGSAPRDLDMERVVEAAEALLPPDLLQALSMRAKTARGQGAGASRLSARRGRPLPPRPGRLTSRVRPDVLATLQAAAPWQRLRGASGSGLSLTAEDIRIKRYSERSERLLIFAIDTSGSAAMARLAEAKGAATHLLASAYQSRDRVALIGFRGTEADLLVPPTRSLTRTKRLLSGMIGGGTTPLATGLKAAGDLAVVARKQGLTPQIILMTDGRANCDLGGVRDRVQASADADRIARWVRSLQCHTVVLDSGLRASADLGRLADLLGARRVPLLRRSGPSSHEMVQAALHP